MKSLVFIFLVFFQLNHVISQSGDECKDILGYGIFDTKTIISEHEFVDKMISVTQKTSSFNASNELSYAMPEFLLPGSSKASFSNRKDFYNSIYRNTSKKEKYFNEVITANQSLISAWQQCMVNKRCSYTARVTDVSSDFLNLTMEVYYSFFNAPDSVKFQLISDTAAFEIMQGFSYTFSTVNNAPYLLKIKRKTNQSFNMIFKTMDKDNYSVAVRIPEIVILPIDNNNYLTVYEGLTWHCNGNHLSTSNRFKLPGQPKNCGRTRPYGRITSNNNTTKGNTKPVFDVNGRLTNTSKGKLVGYVSSVPMDGGLPIFVQGENIITKSFPNTVIYGYLYPL